uniref:Phage portal protein, lambda family n=1 Tax=Candidatus Kentrum sp. UNK TaxID=2126344 RepID=A0A451AV74_9GAMM|nr:MAG: Phage portal protein, lambda family [Candidatus Kentron sp. UNK]VFK69960.1 MAG: Phage portal protein, lambda family [Candidatus Kentron sp. UNK]
MWKGSNCHCDASRRLPFSAMLGLAMRSFLMGGEILATAEWLSNRGNYYATAIQIINPARLCNPDGKPDTDRLRAGVELDRYGAPRAYHIRQALPGDCFVYFPLSFADRRSLNGTNFSEFTNSCFVGPGRSLAKG